MATQTKNTKQELGPVPFSDMEAEFLMEHSLARLATVSAEGEPHVVPIVYEFDGTFLYFSGWNLTNSLKFKNIQQNNRVAIVVDDWFESAPWAAAGIEIRGIAESIDCHGSTCIRIKPVKSARWGI